MNVTGILEPILEKPIEEPEDYRGEDGLLYCGTCRTPKQTRGHGLLEGRLLPIVCACQLRAQEEEKERERKARVEALRSRCLPDKGMHSHTFDAASDAKHIRLARRYVDEWESIRRKNVGLLFWGNTGTGKSFTAHCIANALIDLGVGVRLYSTEEIVARLSDRESREETRHTSGSRRC